MKHEPFNESTEMYLKTVHELAEGEGLVAISALARQLGVSAVSATEMVHRLEEQGYLQHQPYKGIQLTDDGCVRAAQVLRSHQLWECFLHDYLGMSWAAVHDHACRLEHATDEAVTEALDAFLGYPQRCPHGNSVPRGACDSQLKNVRPLMALAAGDEAVVDAVFPESGELLAYLDALGLRPGTDIVLEEIAPFGGPLMVRVGERVVALGEGAARYIFVAASEGRAR